MNLCIRVRTAKVGKQLIYPQIANPHILGFIPQLEIRKFLTCASSLVANPQFIF
jgi:hypothetical protein